MAAQPPRKENTVTEHPILADARTVADAVDMIAAAMDAKIGRRLGSLTTDSLVALLVACDRLARYTKQTATLANDELLARDGVTPGWALKTPGVGRVSVTQGTPTKAYDVGHLLTVIACAAYPKLDGTPCDAVELPAQARAIIERVERVLGSGTVLKTTAIREQGLDPDEFVTVTGRQPKINIQEA